MKNLSSEVEICRLRCGGGGDDDGGGGGGDDGGDDSGREGGNGRGGDVGGVGGTMLEQVEDDKLERGTTGIGIRRGIGEIEAIGMGATTANGE